MCMISHPVYVRHSVHYIYDIIPTMYDNTIRCVHYTTLGICMTSFALKKTSDPLYLKRPQSLWLHIHFRHDITPTVTNISPTVPFSSQPLHWYHNHFCMTSHSLYVWHIICPIYNIISTAYVITLWYLWQQNLDIWNHIQYAVQNIHYPCDITVTSLCHHTHCIESITPTLCMTLHSA